MLSAEGTILTDRQVQVLEYREAGETQREIAERLGTTDANVSAIERAARDNVEKARRTLELARTIRSPARFTADAGTLFEDLVERVYDRGDETGTKVAYTRPELYAHLYEELEAHTDGNRLRRAVEVGLTREGEVEVFAGPESADR
jgi:hypothetical protein